MTLLLSLLDRRLGGINLTVAAPIIFLSMGLTFWVLADSGNPFAVGWFAWSFLGCVAGLGTLLFTKRTAWKVFLLLSSVFLILSVAGPFVMLAIYTREDAWVPVLVLSAWVSLLAPAVDVIFGQSLNQDTASLK